MFSKAEPFAYGIYSQNRREIFLNIPGINVRLSSIIAILVRRKEKLMKFSKGIVPNVHE